MDKKVIARFYATYGKMDGEELVDSFIETDSRDFRKELLESVGFDYAFDSEEEFINGEIDSFTYERHGGDWDEPTGGYIVIYTKQELIDAIEEKASKEIAEVEKMFERANQHD